MGPSWGILGSQIDPKSNQNRVNCTISASSAILSPSSLIFLRLLPILGHLGPSWGRLGAVLGRRGAGLVPSWGHLGLQNRPRIDSKPSKLQHFRVFGYLKPSWFIFLRLLQILGHLGPSWGRLGPSWGRLGEVLEPSSLQLGGLRPPRPPLIQRNGRRLQPHHTKSKSRRAAGTTPRGRLQSGRPLL